MDRKCDIPKKNKNLLVYGAYTKLIEGIKNYDNMQTVYRRIASTFLLATFAALGFIFSSEAINIKVNLNLATILTCFLSLIGISVIGLLDLIFQERIVVGFFVELIKLERTYKWLPQVHHNMIKHGSHHGSPLRKGIFYVGCASTLLLLIGFSFALHVGIHNLQHSIPILFGTIVCIVAYAYSFFSITGRYETLIKHILIKSVHEE